MLPLTIVGAEVALDLTAERGRQTLDVVELRWNASNRCQKL